ncbi:ubiquitin 13 [Striga hermonthica]|uniref:Ubiquitin 13 n=1 Tax=Striga hermonthica TaxID=68872 RepID=A0A9N7N090_STRHE|nr:ubiquitin 13 [Striga hermonthica]
MTVPGLLHRWMSWGRVGKAGIQFRVQMRGFEPEIAVGSPKSFTAARDNVPATACNKIVGTWNITGCLPEVELLIVRVLLSNMQIFARLMSGRTLKLEVESTDTIRSVQSEIESLEWIHTCDHVLLFDGRRIDGCKTLADCGIGKDCTIDVMLSIPSRCVICREYRELIEKVESLEEMLKLARPRESGTTVLLEAERAAHSRLQSKIDLIAHMESTDTIHSVEKDVLLSPPSRCVCVYSNEYRGLSKKVEILEGRLKLARQRESRTAKLLEAERAAHSRLQSKVDLMAQMFDAMRRPT